MLNSLKYEETDFQNLKEEKRNKNKRSLPIPGGKESCLSNPTNDHLKVERKSYASLISLKLY